MGGFIEEGIAMVNRADLVKEWYKPGEVADYLGVTRKTVLNWHKAGEIMLRLDAEKNRYYMAKDEFERVLREKHLLTEFPVDKVAAVYARVGTYDKRRDGSLDRQVGLLVDYGKLHGYYDCEVFTDVGSGLEESRRGLNSLISLVMQGEVSVVYIHQRDRLTRFGYSYLEKLFKAYGTEIIVVSPMAEVDEQEYARDIDSLRSGSANI